MSNTLIHIGDCHKCKRHSVLAPVNVEDEVKQLCAFCFWKLLVKFREIILYKKVAFKGVMVKGQV